MEANLYQGKLFSMISSSYFNYITFRYSVVCQGHIYNDSAGCAAFLANIDHTSDANVSFNGDTYFLPAWSVSILPDCKKVIFNTAKVRPDNML